MSRTKLLIPGPVDFGETVRMAMASPSRPHYGRDWIRLYTETQEMLKRLFQTKSDILIMAGPGTMALEAAMASATEPGETIIIPDNGFFARRLVTVAEGLQLKTVVPQVEEGKPITAEVVREAIEAHPEAKALAIVHHETSTTVLNPLETITPLAKEAGLITIVDAVSSMGGVPLPVDAWGIDFCVTVANKALEIPPALAILSVSPDGWKAIEARQAARGWYLDLKTWKWYAENWGNWHPTPVTMPTSNMVALHTSLMQLLDEGVERRYAAYAAAAHAVRAGLEALGFPPFVEEAYASPLTTAFLMRPGVDADELQRELKEQSGVMISGGIAELHGKILRVGHIGLARKRDYVVAFLLGVEDFLRRHGEDVPYGASLVALEGLEL